MKTYTVEHATYKYGDKQEDETYFDYAGDAIDFAKVMLERHGGRCWVNGEEVNRRVK